MREIVNWLDHVVEYPNRFKVIQISEGLVELQKDPGEILVQGTPMNAKNFINMDYAALEAMLMSSDAVRMMRLLVGSVNGLIGEKIAIKLNNSQPYPHNNSKTTVQIQTPRNTMDYTIEYEVKSVTGGAAGDVVITDKLLNGFKIAFTGSAKSVVVNCYVRGGI